MASGQALPSAVLDACVLFPAALRDTLLRAAEAGLYRLQWSETILEEVRRNLVTTRRASEQQSRDLVELMHEAFPDAAVAGFEPLVGKMANSPKDRHVLAAAVRCRAGIIVTSNLRDFPGAVLEPLNIRAESPDDFLSDLYAREPERLARILVEQAEDLREPPMTALEVLDGIALHAPRFARLLRGTHPGRT